PLPGQPAADAPAALDGDAAHEPQHDPLTDGPSAMTALTVLQNLAARPLVRRVVDRVMGRYAVRRAALLDYRSAVRAQHQTLLRLVRYARKTRFGREHSFERIRSVADYQRRVPLRDYESFWTNYWRDA